MKELATKRVCDIQDGDREWVEGFERSINMLAGMAVEMMEENRTLVLSQIFREMLADKAKEVAEKLRKVRGRLVVDNLGKPLSES